MNVNDSEYEKLLANYRELQLRVTRFSSVEQELINTRDRLDDELILYKKLNQFNKDALKDLSEKKFLQLVSETIVDIFELESSVVFLNDLENDFNSQLFTEGIKLNEREKPVFTENIKQFCKNFSREKSIILKSEMFAENKSFKNFSRGLLFLFSDSELKIDVLLLGLISKEYDPIYQQLKNRHETIFSVFSQQVQSMLANIKKNNKIHKQIKKISESESELRKLSQIATKTKNGVIISDELGKIVWVNEAFESISGYSFAEVSGKKPKEFLQGKDSDQQAILKLKTALQNKEYVEVTLINYKKNGEKYFNALQITPVFDENGKHQSFIALQRDITSEILAKNELIRINSRFELITEKSQIGIWEWDLKSGKTSWNQVLIEQYGAENTQMEKEFFTYWKTFLHPDESERVQNKLNNFINSNNEILEDEFKIINGKTNGIIILRSLIIAERDAKNNLIRLVGTNIDITEKKNNELTLQNSLKQQELISEISLELNNVLKFEIRIQSVLIKLLNHTGVSRVYIFENLDNGAACSNTFEVCNTGVVPQIDELTYISYSDIPYWKTTLMEQGIIYSENIDLLPVEVKEILEPQKIKSIIVFPLNVKGEFFGFIGFDECAYYKKWSKSELELLRAVSGIIANSYERDISEKNLIASEKKYHGIIDNMNLGLVETNLDGNVIFSNKKFHKLSLLEDPKLLALNNKAEHTLKLRLEQKIILGYNKLDENSYEIDFKRKDNLKKTFLVSYGEATDQLGKISGHISVFLDITTVKTLQKNLEDALKERDIFLKKANTLKTFYENVLNNSPSELLVLDPDFMITYSNHHFHREDSIWKNAIGKSLLEFKFVNEHEKNNMLLLTQKINEAIGENKLVQLEENYFTKYGEDCYSLQSILPFYNENNVLENIIISGIDISEIKKIEKNILQKNEELKKINSELDNFVYSVSHDLRSPLLSVKGILALIFKTSELDDKVKNYLKMAEKSILRLDGTIQEILEYSRNSRLGLKLESFNLKEMVSAIYDDLKFSTTKQVEFNIEISCNEIIFSDKSRINTVLKNILGNAFKYLKQDNQKSVVTFYAKKVNTDLLIIVSDNGEGIADNHLSKIFDMFYRASKSSSGTGLGLYICKEIITKLNGEIKIKSKLNEGTTVYVSIPITE